MTESERLLSAFSQMYFFEELVQDSLQYLDQAGNTQELADLLLNMGDTIIAIQIKERSESARTTSSAVEKKWFENKTATAKRQIKNTVEFIRQGKLPSFQNKRSVDIEVRPDAEIIPLVIFLNETLSDYPHVLKKHSAEGLSVNCMSFPDFQTMCRHLISPAEIADYLKYRCDLFEKNGPIDTIVNDTLDEDMLIIRPAADEALVYQFLAEQYGADELKRYDNQFELFRWFIQQTAERSTSGRDDPATYRILLLLAHFKRNEIRAFWERLVLARDKAQKQEYGIVGTLRKATTYAIFFVASEAQRVFSMDYLMKLAQKKGDPRLLLQIYVWWEDSENFHIDYLLLEATEENDTL